MSNPKISKPEILKLKPFIKVLLNSLLNFFSNMFFIVDSNLVVHGGFIDIFPHVAKPFRTSIPYFFVFQVLNKWFSTPCIWRPERTMLQGCFHLLRGVLNDEKPALRVGEFLKNYDVLDLVRLHSKAQFLTGLFSTHSQFKSFCFC